MYLHIFRVLPTSFYNLIGVAGGDDRPYRVPRGARRGLRADRHPGHQEGTQVSVQGQEGELEHYYIVGAESVARLWEQI